MLSIRVQAVDTRCSPGGLIRRTIAPMPVDSQVGLLPWILGGIMTAAGAAALFVTVESPHHTRMSAIAAGAGSAAVPAAAAASAALTTGRNLPPATAAQAPVAAAPPPLSAGQPKSLPALPAGEVWQCTVNGQLTFSDAPCGKDSSIRRLKETNIMDPSPSLPSWAYQRPDAGYPPVPAEPPMTQSYDPDSYDDAYAVNPYILANDRFRRAHEPRRSHHDRGSPDRK